MAAVALDPFAESVRSGQRWAKASLATELSTWRDDLGDEYTGLADDGAGGAKKREASMLLSIAEGHIEEEEDYEEAVRTGGEALALFREIGDRESTIDALRIVIDATRLAAVAREEKEPEKEALGMATQELAKFKEEGDRAAQANMLLSLALLNMVVRGGKKRDEGARQAKEALTAAQELGDKKLEATSFLVTYRIYSMMNNKSEALASASRALAVYRELGDRKGEARALHSLGLAEYADEQLESALPNLKGALAAYAELGNKKMEAFEHTTLSSLHIARDSPKEALNAAKEALKIAEEFSGGKAWHTQALGSVVEAYVKNKEPEAGVKLLKKTLASFREAGATRREVETLELVATTLMEEKDYEAALPRAEEALSLARDLNDKRLQVGLLHTIGRVQLERKEFTEVLSCVKEMVPLCMQLDDPVLEASAHHLAATVHMQREKWIDAMRAAKDAKELLTKSGDKHAEGRALLIMSAVHRMNSEDDQAVSASTEAQFLFQKEKDKKWEARSLFEVAETQAFSQNFPAALRAAKKALTITQEFEEKESQAIVLCIIATIQLSLLIDQALADQKRPPPANVVDETMAAQEKALQFAQKAGEKKLLIPMNYGCAQVHLVKRATAEAMTHIEIARKMCEQQNDHDGEVVGMVLEAYCLVMDQQVPKATTVADSGLAIARKNNDERGEWLCNNIKGIVETMNAANAGAAEENEVDPEMLKLKINDVANSLMGIESLAGDTPLMDAGLDSLSMVEFRNELVKEFPGVDLPGSLLFDYPTVNTLTEFVAEGIKRSAKALK